MDGEEDQIKEGDEVPSIVLPGIATEEEEVFYDIPDVANSRPMIVGEPEPVVETPNEPEPVVEMPKEPDPIDNPTVIFLHPSLDSVYDEAGPIKLDHSKVKVKDIRTLQPHDDEIVFTQGRDTDDDDFDFFEDEPPPVGFEIPESPAAEIPEPPAEIPEPPAAEIPEPPAEIPEPPAEISEPPEEIPETQPVTPEEIPESVFEPEPVPFELTHLASQPKEVAICPTPQVVPPPVDCGGLKSDFIDTVIDTLQTVIPIITKFLTETEYQNDCLKCHHADVGCKDSKKKLKRRESVASSRTTAEDEFYNSQVPPPDPDPIVEDGIALDEEAAKELSDIQQQMSPIDFLDKNEGEEMEE